MDELIGVLATLVSGLDENEAAIVEHLKLLPADSPLLEIVNYINLICRHHVEKHDATTA